MKLEKLFEMPDLVNREMPEPPTTWSYSTETINRLYDPIGRLFVDGVECYGFVKKNGSGAIFGTLGKRTDGDNEIGFLIRVAIDLKHETELSYFNDITVKKENVIQIDGVLTSEKYKFTGAGSSLYFLLAKAGYVIVSDHLQYLGGQALWKKLGRKAALHGCAVYIIDDGVVRLDDNGEAIIYDGLNIDDDTLWGSSDLPPRDRKKHILFALRTKM